MERFLTRHASRITGILSGFDRMLFRGTLRSISYVDGLDKFLSSQRVLYNLNYAQNSTFAQSRAVGRSSPRRDEVSVRQ